MQNRIFGLSGALSLISAAAMLALSSGCGGSDAWTSALKQTSPPNPERSEISAPGKVQSSKAREETAPRRAAADSAESASTAGGKRRAEGDAPQGDATLLVLLQGPRECFAGAVRVYVGGRYVGRVGEDGRLQVPVPAGGHNLAVWDSRGQWEAEFSVEKGGTATVTIRCEERRGEGRY